MVYIQRATKSKRGNLNVIERRRFTILLDLSVCDRDSMGRAAHYGNSAPEKVKLKIYGDRVPDISIQQIYGKYRVVSGQYMPNIIDYYCVHTIHLKEAFRTIVTA